MGESAENNNVTIVYDNDKQNKDAIIQADTLHKNFFDSAQNEKLHQPPTTYASVDLIYSENFHKLSKEIPKNTDCKIQLKVTVMLTASDLDSGHFYEVVCGSVVEKIIENGSFIFLSIKTFTPIFL